MSELQELSERERTILYAVVNSYVTAAEPVGSRSVVKQFGLDLSPATVRNTMADLEDAGFLKQVHTSSGRVPTDKGYRYFVHHLMRVQTLTMEERARIEQDFDQKLNDTDAVLRQTTQLLALITQQAGIAQAPEEASVRVQRLELIPLAGTRVAVMMVDNYGRVRSASVDLSVEIAPDELQRISRFLNEQLHGLEVESLAEGVRQRLSSYFDEQRLIAQRALEVLSLLPRQQKQQLFLDGAAQLFVQPEFNDIHRAREVFGLFEQNQQIAEALRSGLLSSSGGFRPVFIGEDGTPLEGLSVVAAPYAVDGKQVGMVGILGPRRMPYSRLTSVVDYTAQVVSRLLTRLAG